MLELSGGTCGLYGGAEAAPHRAGAEAELSGGAWRVTGLRATVMWQSKGLCVQVACEERAFRKKKAHEKLCAL